MIGAAKELKRSMMKHLFTYGPVPVGERDKVKLKDTEIGRIPEEWGVVNVGDVFDVKQGKQLSSKESHENKIKRPFLRTVNVLWGKIETSDLDEMYFTPEEFEKLKLRKGDILLCEGGDIGRTAIFDLDGLETAYQNHLHRLRAKTDNVVNYFFSYWMQYSIKQKKMYISQGNRTTIPNLSQSRLKSFIIPLPPLSVQKRIAEILSAIDEKIEAEERKRKALEEVFRSMLHNLMTGKIRVKDLDLRKYGLEGKNE